MPIARIHIAALVAVGGLLWACAVIITGGSVKLDMIAPFGVVVGGLSFCIVVFETYAWRWRLFRGWFVKRPILHGTWKVNLQSSYIDPETKKTIPPIACFVVIRQSLFRISIRLLTVESSSVTIAANIVENTDGTFDVAGVYTNTPKQPHRHRSEIHHGALLLHIGEHLPRRIEGEYWTDRKTSGTLELLSRTNREYSSFVEAEEFFMSPS